MTKQEYIEWRQGRAAFKKGEALSLTKPWCWQIGWFAAKHDAAVAASK